jgi:hypothetical protein
VRDQKVILDLDLGELYGVPTKALNQAVKRNSARFPEDFLFQLTADEVAALNRSQIVTGSQKHRDPRFRPYAFTEHGAIMAATVLNSPRAVQMSLFVVRAFVRMRAALKESADLAQRLSLLENELKIRFNSHESAVVDRLQRILEILHPPKREIGFHIKEDGLPYRIKKRSARL